MDNKRLINVIRRSFSPYRLSVYQLLRERAIAASADYAQSHLGDAMIFDSAPKLWSYSASRAKILDGLVVEFGVFKGRSINHFAAQFQESRIHGFDSFEGLSEDWKGYHLPKGTFNMGGTMPKVESNVTLHKGWFNATLPDFLEKHDSDIRLCHIDCDTYESALYVLDRIAKRSSKGSIVVFDEYFGYPNWQAGEFRAWKEVCAATGLKYKYVAFSDMQVSVEIV